MNLKKQGVDADRCRRSNHRRNRLAIARRRRPGAELLQGERWLRFLDGPQGRSFSAGAGRVLLDGGFRPQLEAEQFDAVRVLARVRFLELMEGRR